MTKSRIDENSVVDKTESPDYDTFPIEIDLEYPIRRGTGDKEVVYDKLTISRRLQAKDLKGIPSSNLSFDDNLRIISRLTGEPMSTIELLDGKDMMQFTGIINYFLGLSQ